MDELNSRISVSANVEGLLYLGMIINDTSGTTEHVKKMRCLACFYTVHD